MALPKGAYSNKEEFVPTRGAAVFPLKVDPTEKGGDHKNGRVAFPDCAPFHPLDFEQADFTT